MKRIGRLGYVWETDGNAMRTIAAHIRGNAANVSHAAPTTLKAIRIRSVLIGFSSTRLIHLYMGRLCHLLPLCVIIADECRKLRACYRGRICADAL